MSGSLVVISGSSGTGKSTLCKALQEALLPDIWLHFSVDSILYCLPQSVLDLANHQNEWSSVDPKLIASSAYACAQSLLSAGHNVLFDCVVLSEKRALALLSAFQEYRPVLVGLSCSWEEIQRRTVARGDRTIAEAEQGFRQAGGHLPYHYTFETTNIPADVIASQLAHRLRAGTVGAPTGHGGA